MVLSVIADDLKRSKNAKEEVILNERRESNDFWAKKYPVGSEQSSYSVRSIKQLKYQREMKITKFLTIIST